jgi:hypothetical protein
VTPGSPSSISTEFAKAIVSVQGGLEEATKDRSNPAFRSRYADLGNCWDACRDALQKACVAVLQFPIPSEPGFVRLQSVLVYGPTGEMLGTDYTVPVKDPTNPQALGSAITYARRYALCAILGICAADDDGNAAAKPKPDDKAKVKPFIVPLPSHLIEKWYSLAKKSERKELYTELRNSEVSEPLKTETLAAWAKVIKDMKDD